MCDFDDYDDDDDSTVDCSGVGGDSCSGEYYCYCCHVMRTKIFQFV
jgi:hypothetical protein